MAARSAVVEAALALLRVASNRTRIIGEDPVASVAEQTLRVNPLAHAHVARRRPLPRARAVVGPLHRQQAHPRLSVHVVSLRPDVVRAARLSVLTR
ncbi:MAG: hypothetical protein MKZ95_14875 [Pirellulales bacterium]|nr:hypothetical protein [Pirellulales bacterium]